MRFASIDEKWIARLLVVGIAVSMTRAFALTNILEVSLFLFVLLNNNLRACVVASLRDLRVIFIIIFWMWVGFTSLWSEATTLESFKEWWSWRKLILVPICFALFDTEKSKEILAASIVAICILFLFASWLGALGIVESSRPPSGLLENHSTQGLLFGYSAYVCLSMLHRSEKSIWRMLLVALAIIFAANVVFITTGRTGYVSILIFCLIMVVLAGTSAKKLLVGLLCALSVVALIFINDKSRQNLTQTWDSAWLEIETEQGALDSTTIRIWMWKNTIDVVKKHRWLGTGAGGFEAEYSDVVSKYDGARSVTVDDPHNQYLHIAAEHGIVGLIIFLLAIFSWLYGFLLKQTALNVWSRLGLGILVVTAVNGLYNGHFSAFVEGRLCWIAIASFASGSEKLSLDQLKSLILSGRTNAKNLSRSNR